LPIIDTHQHLIFPERYEYPWVASIPRLAGRAFRETDYANAAVDCDITSTVFVEATGSDPAEHDEAAFVESLSTSSGSMIAGIVASCRPEDLGFPSFLDDLQLARLVGVRRVLYDVPAEIINGRVFRGNIRLLGARSLAFDLCVHAAQLPIAAELARSCPGVTFVLDHCGGPKVAAGALDRWRDDLTRLAANPNVVCKISGVLAYCDPTKADSSAVAPFVEHCIGAFGWDRVVWGSDWPVVEIASSLRTWVSISRAIVDGESDTNQSKLFSGNATTIYNLSAAAAQLAPDLHDAQ
jgi:predicted TIM-barrel fold metal-dependent hydrolase